MRGIRQSPERKGPPAWKLEPGTKWLYNFDGILWPVCILNEDFVDEEELHLMDDKVQPALQLGHHTFFWAKTAKLLDYTHEAGGFDISDLGGGVNSIISLAHSEALTHRDEEMFYWKGVMASERMARGFENGDSPQDQHQVLDIKDDGDKGVINLGAESDDDEEKVAEGDIVPFTSNPKYATIIIGKTKEPVVIPLHHVKANRHLSECTSMRDTEDGGQAIVVSRRAFDDHKPTPFKLIAIWMHVGHYRPRISEKNRFPTTLTRRERVQEMERIGQVFDLAREMLIFEIFEYLWRRYEALKPWPPQHLLQLTMMIWRRPHTADEFEELLRSDLLNVVADNYVDMVGEDCGSALHDLFSRYADFAKAVFDKRYQAWITDNPDEDEESE